MADFWSDYYTRLIKENPDRDINAIMEGIQAVHADGAVPPVLPSIDNLEQLGSERLKANEPGYAETIAKGVSRGGVGLVGSVGSLGRWAGEVTGNEALAEGGKKLSAFEGEVLESDMIRPDENTFRGSFFENPSFKRAAGIVGEAVPSVALAFGIGTAALPLLGETGATVAGAGALGTLGGAGQYEEARQAGKGVAESSLYGGIRTATETLLEMIPLGKYLGEGKGFVKGFVGGATAEAGTEAMQQIAENIIAKVGYEPTREITRGVIESMIGGAGAGGPLGGFTGYTHQAQKAIDDAKENGVTDEEIDQLKTEIVNQVQTVQQQEQPQKIMGDQTNFPSFPFQSGQPQAQELPKPPQSITRQVEPEAPKVETEPEKKGAISLTTQPAPEQTAWWQNVKTDGLEPDGLTQTIDKAQSGDETAISSLNGQLNRLLRKARKDSLKNGKDSTEAQNIKNIATEAKAGSFEAFQELSKRYGQTGAKGVVPDEKPEIKPVERPKLSIQALALTDAVEQKIIDIKSKNPNNILIRTYQENLDEISRPKGPKSQQRALRFLWDSVGVPNRGLDKPIEIKSKRELRLESEKTKEPSTSTVPEPQSQPDTIIPESVPPETPAAPEIPPVPESATEPKKAFQMTKEEYLSAIKNIPENFLTDPKFEKRRTIELNRHRKKVQAAFRKGESIPESVLAQYPKLKEKSDEVDQAIANAPVIEGPSLVKVKKQPWEMTRGEWDSKIRFYRSGKTKNAEMPDGEKVILKQESTQKDFLETSKDFLDLVRKRKIARAVSEGKQVPPEVLKDYPELVKQSKTNKDVKAEKQAKAEQFAKRLEENKKIELTSGDEVKFIPDEKMAMTIEGIVVETINNGDGVHVLDPSTQHTHRIWLDKGKLEKTKAYAKEESVKETKGEKRLKKRKERQEAEQIQATTETPNLTKPAESGNIEAEIQSASESDIDNILDDVFGPEPQAEPEPQPTAKDLAIKAGIESVQGVKDAIKGLTALFGSPNKLSSGLTFDEDTYAQAKPHFQSAWNHAKEAGFTIKQLAEHLFNTFGANIKPYLKRFLMEQKEGQNGTTDNTGGQRGSKEGNDQVSPGGKGSTDVSTTENIEQTEQVLENAGETTDGSVQGGKITENVESGVESETGGRPDTTVGPDRSGSSPDMGGNNSSISGLPRPTDHRITPGSIDREGGWKKSAESNIAAIELLKQITSENRAATADEQAVLAKYVGWGSSELANKMFPGYAEKGRIMEGWADSAWSPLVKRLNSILTPEELKTAARSTQYAHYTSESVIKSIYKALQRMGFKGGKILEPGMGVGNFVGLLPDNMRKNTVYTGIEMDHVTAGIAKLLYPNQNMLQADFTKKILPKNFFDAAIGNPPFGDIKILNDPEYKKNRFSLHNYFFAKALDRVRPGGLLVFVTSHHTMDSQSDQARQYLADKADLLGAIRLPQTAFKKNAGTEVVTDVLFLQKRVEGAEPAGQAWINQDNVKIGDKQELINEYFVKHPEMVLGKHSLEGTMYGPNQYTVLPVEGDIESQFNNAVENLPENIYQKIKVNKGAFNEQLVIERDFNPENKKEGGIYLSKDGHIMVTESGTGVLASTIPQYTKKLNNKKNIELVKSYISLRNALKLSHKAQLEDGNWESELKNLNKEYEKFVKKHGNILDFTTTIRKQENEDGEIEEIEYRNFKNDKILAIDVEYPLVRTLETISSNGVIEKSKVLFDRTIKRPKVPEVTSVPDALAVSLDQVGQLDIDHIAKIAHKTPEEVVDVLGDLIYKNPETNTYILADEYLSGNVVQKLEEAKEAAKLDKAYERNVEALEKNQPEPLSHDKIKVTMGAPWVPVPYYQQFATEILKLPPTEITHQPVNNVWSLNGKYKPQSLRDVTNEWSTKKRGPNEIFEAALNNRTSVIKKPDFDANGRPISVTDTAEMAAVAEMTKKMRQRFNSWVWEDAERASELMDVYNTKVNVIKGRSFDGSHLTLPGTSLHIKLFDHQKRAIWRIIQDGSTYLDHAVGAGKTFVMIAAGMEMRRLGMINKPIYAVPKHMLSQFAQEFNELYPTAEIMVADEINFHTDNRKRFMAQAALNNPDAIIVTHSSFGLLKVKEKTVAPVRNAFLQDLRESLAEMEDDNAPRHKIKKMENRIQKAEQRFDSMILGGDGALTFEELGADFLFVDEAHAYRKLDFTTNRQMKGIDSEGSVRAIDMFIKTQWLNQQNPGRSHVFASGTPIVNTLAELYTIMRFFAKEQLYLDGIAHFDSWGNMYGEAVTALEMNAAGKHEPVERFANFINIPELMSRVRMFMDVLTSTQLGTRVERPAIKGGMAEIVLAPKNPGVKKYQDEVLMPRIERSKKWKPSKEQPGNPDPIINIITDGRLSSVDMRFVQPSAKNDPTSKLNIYIDGIIDSYNESADETYLTEFGGTNKSDRKGSGIVCFYNVGFGKAVTERRGFDSKGWVMKRLKDAGIPLSQVAWIDDYATAQKKQVLFKDMRLGKKRILFGSAEKMGTGMNIQNRLKYLHYLDAPWFPANVEQPDGRILRQGNQNKEVVLKRYATEGGYDATMWQMVARKSRSIEQAFVGDKNIRTIEDVSESSQYEMAAALASGDPRFIKLVNTRTEIEQLSNLESSHINRQRQLATEKRYALSDIEGLKQTIAKYKSIGDVEYIGPKIDATIKGKKFEERKDFGEALKAEVKKALVTKTSGTIGTISGFNIDVGFTSYSGWIEVVLRFNKDIHIGLNGMSFGTPESIDNIDEVGTSKKITNAINSIPSKLSSLEKDLTEAEQKLIRIGKVLGTPFAHAQELGEKIAEAARLEQELASEGQDVPKTAIQKTSEPIKHWNQKLSSAKVGEPEQYSISQTNPNEVLTQEDIQDIFTNQTVTKFKDGSYWVSTKGNYGFKINTVEQITPSKAAMQIGYGKSKLENGDVILGKYEQQTITLDKTYGDKWTLAHESVHMLEDLKIFKDREIAVLKRRIKNQVNRGLFKTSNKEDIGGKEDRAEYISQQLKARSERGFLGRIIQKAQDFIDSLVNLFIQTSGGVVRSVESGKVYDRGVGGTSTPNEEQYQIKDLYNKITTAIQEEFTDENGKMSLGALTKRSGFQYPNNNYKDMVKGLRKVQTPFDLARNYPKFKALLDAQLKRIGQTNKNSMLDREKTEPYFALDKSLKAGIDKALVRGDVKGQEYSEHTLRDVFKLNDEQVAGYNAIRTALNDKLDTLIGVMLNDLFDGDQAITRSMIEIVKKNQTTEDMINSFMNMGIEVSNPEKLTWVAEWAKDRKGYIPHKWNSEWLVKVELGKDNVHMLEVPTIKAKIMPFREQREQAAFIAATNTIKAKLGLTEKQIRKLYNEGKIFVVKSKNMPMDMFEGDNVPHIMSIMNAGVDRAYNEFTNGMSQDQINQFAGLKDVLKNSYEELYLSKGWGQHLIGRKGVQGYQTEDLSKVLGNYIVGFNAFQSKKEAAKEFASAMKKINPTQTPEMYSAAKEYVSDMLGTTSEAAWFKKIAGTYFLAGDISAATLNLTQNWTHAVGLLRKIKGDRIAEKDLYQAMIDVGAEYIRAKKTGTKMFSEAHNQIAQDEADAVRKALEQGHFDPGLFGEQTGLHGNKVWTGRVQDLHSKLFIAFTGAESWNRFSTFMAAYRRAKNAGMKDAYEQAVQITLDSHFLYGKGNRPELLRKTGAIGNVAYTFMTYPVNNLIYLKHRFQELLESNYKGDKEGIKTGMKVIGSNFGYLFALGGITGLPFSWLAEMIYNLFADDEDDWERLIRKYTPDMVGKTITRGIPAALLQNDMSWRVQGTDVIGVPIGFQIIKMGQKRLEKAGELIDEHQYGDAIFHIMPDLLRNPYKAMVGLTEGGERAGVAPIKYTPFEAATKTLGFTPSREADVYKTSDIVEKVRQARLAKLSGFSERYIQAKKNNNLYAMQKLKEEIQKQASETADRKRTITWKDVKRNAKLKMKSRQKGYLDRTPKYMKKFQKQVESDLNISLFK